MANDIVPMPRCVEGGAAGQTVAYAFVEITSGINFLLNMPKFQEMMQECRCKSCSWIF